MVGAGRGVRDAQRAIDAVAVLKGWVTIFIIAVMAGLTEVCRAEAAEEGHTAAELALPVDLLTAMLIASRGASTDLTQKTVLAEKILLFGVLLFSVCHFLLAIDQASKVRLLALVALVERASMVRELLWFAKVGICWILETLIIQNTLLLSILEGQSLDLLFQAKERAKNCCYRLRDASDLDLLLAARTRHESKGDTESCPFVLEQLHYAIRVEDVPAGQFRARFFSKLLSVADGAKLCLIDSLEVVTRGFSAISLQAW